ncbi:hypothetical protein MRX96_059417 [Rhipicephalus microplus]
MPSCSYYRLSCCANQTADLRNYTGWCFEARWRSEGFTDLKVLKNNTPVMQAKARDGKLAALEKLGRQNTSVGQ